MKRRLFLAVVAIAAGRVGGQPARVPKRVAYLTPGDSTQTRNVDLLKGFLGQMGYVDGASIVFEVRFTAGHNERAEPMARELVAWRPDVMVGGTTPIVVALHNVTKTIPIVMDYVSDPVGAGLVSTLARPGTNVTGATDYGNDMASKWLQFAHDIRPGGRKIGVLTSGDAPHPVQLQAIKEAGFAKGLDVVPLAGDDAAAIELSFARAASENLQVAIVLGGSRQQPYRSRIADLAIERGIATVAINRQYADAGCLMSYGLNHVAHFKLVASYVARILAGAKPADLPVEQPSTFELVLNLKTAQALQMTLPARIVALADQVIR